MIEDKIVENVIKAGSDKLSPMEVLRKILMFIITLKIVLETLKIIGGLLLKAINMVRQSILISLQNETWKIMLWVKTWRLIFGLIAGLALEYYFQLGTKILAFVEGIL